MYSDFILNLYIDHEFSWKRNPNYNFTLKIIYFGQCK